MRIISLVSAALFAAFIFVAPVASAQSVTTVNIPQHAFPVGDSNFGQLNRTPDPFTLFSADIDASGWTKAGTIAATLEMSEDGGTTWRTLTGAVIDSPPPWTFKTITSSTIHLGWFGSIAVTPSNLRLRITNGTGNPVSLGPTTIVMTP